MSGVTNKGAKEIFDDLLASLDENGCYTDTDPGHSAIKVSGKGNIIATGNIVIICLGEKLRKRPRKQKPNKFHDQKRD